MTWSRLSEKITLQIRKSIGRSVSVTFWNIILRNMKTWKVPAAIGAARLACEVCVAQLSSRCVRVSGCLLHQPWIIKIIMPFSVLVWETSIGWPLPWRGRLLKVCHPTGAFQEIKIRGILRPMMNSGLLWMNWDSRSKSKWTWWQRKWRTTLADNSHSCC